MEISIYFDVPISGKNDSVLTVITKENQLGGGYKLIDKQEVDTGNGTYEGVLKNMEVYVWKIVGAYPKHKIEVLIDSGPLMSGMIEEMESRFSLEDQVVFNPFGLVRVVDDE